MDEARARIYDDLRGVVEGELYFEPLDRAPYAHDASLYEIDPLGVIVPRSEDDVVTVVRYAAENRIAAPRAGRGDRHRRRVARARAGRRSEPASSQGHRDRRRARGGRGGRRARRAQRAARAARAPARADPERFRRHDHRRDDRGRRGGGAVDALWLDRRPGRSVAGRLRAGRGGRPWVRALAGVRGRAGRLQGPDRPQAPDALSQQRKPARADHAGRRRAIAPATRSRRPPARRESTWAGWSPARRGRWRSTLQAVLRTVPIPAAQGVVLLPFAGLARRRGVRARASGTRACRFLVRPVRPPLAQPGPRRRPVVPRLDRRGGRGGPDGRVRGQRPRRVAAKLRLVRESAARTRDCWSRSRLQPSSGRSASACSACGGWSSRC